MATNLIDVFTRMKMDAFEKQAAEQKAFEKQAEIEVLEKYAQAADNLLAEEFGDNYDEQDVIDLASALIDNDIQAVEAAEAGDAPESVEPEAEVQEKVAEVYQLGQIFAEGLIDRLNSDNQ